MKIYLNHEMFQAGQSALHCVHWSEPILKRLPKTAAAAFQPDRARPSIPLNIAEGQGKFTTADKCKCFDIAHGSPVECAACLDLLLIQPGLNEAEPDAGRTIWSGVLGLLVGLINSKWPARFRTDEVDYRVGGGGAGVGACV